MKLSAKDAQNLLANSKAAIDNQLDKCEFEIRNACKEGKNFVEVVLSEDYFVSPVISSLKELGYKVSQTHSRGIDIRW